jgi:hypothetical protein
MKMYLPSFIFFLTCSVVWASQTYVPPPPPKLPTALSKETVALGKALFERNVFVSGKVEIHNYLGTRSCGSCHDKKTPLEPKSLARKFGTLRDKINSEITTRMGGQELPPEDPALEALVQYIVKQYRLQEIKVSK